MSLDKNSSVPLYKQLEQTIRQKIASGELTPGSCLPTEGELSEKYNISRVTVRKALGSLTQSGLLTRTSGKGTFVAEAKMQREVNRIFSFSEMCYAQNIKPGSKTIKTEICDPSDEEINQLGLAPSDKILVIERIRYASEKPVMIETTKFPESFFFLFDEDLNNVSLYDILREKYNISFSHSAKTIEITFANYVEAKYLGISKGDPLLSIDSLVSDDADVHRYISRQLCIGNKFKLTI